MNRRLILYRIYRTGRSRFPFNSENGSRQCCGSKTFNNVNLDCCGDTLVTKGSCAATVAQRMVTERLIREPDCFCDTELCLGTDGSVCLCSWGYGEVDASGNCRTKSCDSYLCKNGVCLKESGQPVCKCDTNWTGAFCDTEQLAITEIASSSTSSTDSPTALFEPSLTSTADLYSSAFPLLSADSPSVSTVDQCQTEEAKLFCGQNGDCVPDGNSFSCFCASGFQGRRPRL